MSGITGFVALVISIVALAVLKSCRDAIRHSEDRIDDLEREIRRLRESAAVSVEEAPSPPPEEVVEEVVSAPVPELRPEIAVPPQVDIPAPPAPEEVPEISVAPAEEALGAVIEPKTPEIPPSSEPERRQALEAAKSLFDRIDRERWATLEAKLGKQWMTWVGAVVLFLSAGFFVKYAFEHEWLGEGARVILGVVAGIGVTAAGERFIRRKMRALGQGLVGTGLAILYVSLYAAYGFYGLLPQKITFVLMALVTTGGMVLAVVHDAVAISFLAVLGGFLTPVILRTGDDPRDALFAYLLLLDLGVLGVAFFKRWRALDVLAFIGTWALFTGWYFQFRHAPTYSIAPTLLWLAAFYVVFLIQPFVYHLRLATPIVGERFFLAVSNAVGMFGMTYTILHSAHKHVLGLITMGMSASYLVLGSLTRKRLPSDQRAVFGFLALSVMFLTIAIPIHLDFHGVTVAWAVKAPVLLYLAYKYSYFPVRAGVLIPLALAAGRIFTIHWPLHDKTFTPIVNPDFGTAIFVALAGGAYALIHHLQRKHSSPIDHVLQVWTGIASAFLALIVLNIEIWQWLDLSGRDHLIRWACAFVCAVGAAGFLGAGIKLRSVHARFSGLVALSAAGAFVTWDYALGIHVSYLLIFNGRFFAAFAAIIVLFFYAFTYRRWHPLCRPDEKSMSIPFYGACIILLVLLLSCETWQWLALRDHHYIARYVLPFVWVAGTGGYLGAGFKLRSFRLRVAGLAVLTVAGFLAGIGYAYRVESECLLCLNGRFAAALAVPLMTFVYAFALRKLRNICEPVEQYISEALYGIAIFLLVILATAEVWLWLDARDNQYLARCLIPLIWVAGAAGYFGAGFRLRSFRLRGVGLAVLTIAGILASVGYAYRIESDCLLCLNGRFAAALAVPLMAFVYAFALRKRRDLCEPDEQYVSEALYGIGIFLLVILTTAEVWLWFDARGNQYLARCFLPLIWVAGAAGYLGAGFKLRSFRLRVAGLAVLVIAGILAGVGYAYRVESDCLLCLNGRFAAALAVPLMAFMYAFALRKRRDLCEPVEQYVSEALYGIGIFLLVILTTAEVWFWLDARDQHYLIRCLVPLIWVSGAAGYLGAGIKLRTARLRYTGLAFLAMAGLFAGCGYHFDMDAGYLLYLNGRLLAALAVVLMVFAHGFILRRFRDLCPQDEQLTAKILYGFGIALLFVLLSGETFLYFRETIADRERARWISQMSLSVTWGAYAIALLSVGFWRKARSLRLAALGLFGLTALKLVLIDMAKVQEVYRIVSFLVLGVLMIGASYLYHRVEKRLNHRLRQEPRNPS